MTSVSLKLNPTHPNVRNESSSRDVGDEELEIMNWGFSGVLGGFNDVECGGLC